MELCSILCGRLDGNGVPGRMDTCLCVAEPLCCSPKTITTSLIDYTQVQNGFPGGAVVKSPPVSAGDVRDVVSSRDGYLLELTGWTKGSQAS